MKRKDFFKSAGAALIAPSLFGFNTVTETSKLDITQNEIYEYTSRNNIYRVPDNVLDNLLKETSYYLGDKNSIKFNNKNKTMTVIKSNISLLDFIAAICNPDFPYYLDVNLTIFRSYLVLHYGDYLLVNENLLLNNLAIKKSNKKEFNDSITREAHPYSRYMENVYESSFYYKFDKPIRILV